MFYSICLDNKINNAHKKTPRIVYFSYKLVFQELLDKKASFSVHQRKLMGFRQEFLGKFSKLTELYHISFSS